MAKLEQRVDDLTVDVRVMAPLVVQMAEQRLMLDNVRGEVRGCTERLDGLRKDIQEERERLQRSKDAEQKTRDDDRKTEGKESRRNRIALFTGVVFVILATVGNLIVQLTMVHHP
jgi:uncharacterized coiled-coil protein SlyX